MDVSDLLSQVKETVIPTVNKNNAPEQLQEVSQEFEALFVKMMLDAMLANRNKEDNLSYGGLAEDIFEDLLYSEYSKKIAQSGDFAIADMIVNQFSSDRVSGPSSLP